MSPELQTFEAADLRRFLEAVDRHLSEPVRIVLLGGSAIALYGVEGGTMDIDTWEGDRDLVRLQSALARAREETGLDIPVERADVGDVPYNYEDRLYRVPGPWVHLEVVLLERHDLVLSKAMRAGENDLAAIQKLHEIHPLDLQTLVSRYVDEMIGHAIGNESRLDQNFALVIDRLFGEIEAERAEERVRQARQARDAAKRQPGR